MPYRKDISKAIGAHGEWKTRLRAAVNSGRLEVGVDEVADEARCEFGRWFATLPESARSDPRHATVDVLHARFHREAAEVVRLIEAGRTSQAQRALEIGSAFERATHRLVVALIEWSQAA